jgi:chloramphenicol O-acetyltransferase type B
MKAGFRARAAQLLRHWRRTAPSSLRERYPACRIGAGSYGDLEAFDWGEGSTFSIGCYTSIGTGVKLYLGGEHRTDWVTTFPFSALWPVAGHIAGHPSSKGNVAIGSDVWIASEAFILSGVTIGDGAVVGARAVVSKDVPAYAVVAGNPSRIVKYRFDPATIERLLRIKWWEWDTARIERALPALLSCDIEAFLQGAESGKI